MKLSQLEISVIKTHSGISEDSPETNTLLEMYKGAAKSFILGYTGLTAEELDNHEDITVACCCLVDDMYNNRSMIVSRDTLNPTVRQILDLHRKNLLA